jgi:hypothetical protein
MKKEGRYIFENGGQRAEIGIVKGKRDISDNCRMAK